jgi:hypothetical protein
VRKRRACFAHAGQLPERFYALQERATRFRGIERGCQHAEGFIRHVRSHRLPAPAAPLNRPSLRVGGEDIAVTGDEFPTTGAVRCGLPHDVGWSCRSASNQSSQSVPMGLPRVTHR